MAYYPRNKEDYIGPAEDEPLHPPEDPDFGPPVWPYDTPPGDTPPGDPPPGDTPPGDPPPPSTTTNKTTDWSSILRGLFGNLTGGNMMNPAMLAAYLGTAYNHYKDSDRWTGMAEKYAEQLDPFGKERPGYQDKLRSLMTDPEGYVKNDPAYASAIRMALGPVQSQMRAKGYGNSGNILTALTQVAGDTTNKYLSDLRKDLGNFSGAQFGPNAAASILSQGLAGSIDSRNKAIGDIGALLGNLWRTDKGGGGGGGGGGDDNPLDIANIIRTTSGLFKPGDLTRLISAFKLPNGGLDITRMQEAGLTPNQIQQLITNGEDTGTPDDTNPFPEGLDPTAPPEGYDSWNEFYSSFDLGSVDDSGYGF